MTALLSVAGLQMRFGGLLAVDGVDFQVRHEEIFAIIGPNGAGKTTVFNCVGGFYAPSGGRVLLEGADITGLPGHQVAQRGLVRTFQNIRLFRRMTVLDNLLVAQHRQLRTGLLHGLLATPAYREAERQALARAAAWLDRLGLRELAHREAGSLSYGHQRRLEIVRCLLTRPRLLMLDEPAAGLNPQEKIELARLIGELSRELRLSVLLIEHDMGLVMGLSHRILVMEHGRPIATGTPEQVRGDQRVIQAYLGEG